MLSCLISYLASSVVLPVDEEHPDLPPVATYTVECFEQNVCVSLEGSDLEAVANLKQLILDQVDRDEEHPVVMNQKRVLTRVLSQELSSLVVEITELSTRGQSA